MKSKADHEAQSGSGAPGLLLPAFIMIGIEGVSRNGGFEAVRAAEQGGPS